MIRFGNLATPEISLGKIDWLNAAITAIYPDGILILDEAGQIVFINQEYADTWNISSKFLTPSSITSPLQTVLHPLANLGSSKLRENYLNAHKTEKWHIEIRLNDERVLEHFSIPLLENNEKYTGRIWCFRDISEFKKKEEELKARALHLKIAADSSQVAIWEVNLKTNKMIWDDASLNLYKLCRENLTGNFEEWVKCLHPADRDIILAAYQATAEGHQDFHGNYRIVYPDGETGYVTGHLRVVRDKAGKPESVIGTNWDNTAFAFAQIELQRKHQAINSCKSAFFWVDLEGKLFDVNEFACNSLGYTREELCGMHVWQFDPDFQVEAWYSMLPELRISKMLNFRSRHQRKDGAIFPVEVVCNLISSEGGEYCFAFVQDISERKLIESRLLSNEKELRALYASVVGVREEERKSLAREMHDELGQLITSLRFSLNLLEARLIKAGPFITSQLKRMENLMDQSVSIVRRISNEMRPSMLDNLGLRAALENHIEKFKNQTSVDCDLTYTLDHDAIDDKYDIQLFRIIQEALTNAARHSKATLIRINLLDRNEDILLKIRDNGIGFSKKPDEGQKTFGLLGMRERVLSMGGTMVIQSGPDMGFGIEIIIPRHRIESKT